MRRSRKPVWAIRSIGGSNPPLSVESPAFAPTRSPGRDHLLERDLETRDKLDALVAIHQGFETVTCDLGGVIFVLTRPWKEPGHLTRNAAVHTRGASQRTPPAWRWQTA